MNEKYICVECATLLRDAGCKVTEVENWSTQKIKCARCKNTRFVYGVLETEAKDEK